MVNGRRNVVVYAQQAVGVGRGRGDWAVNRAPLYNNIMGTTLIKLSIACARRIKLCTRGTLNHLLRRRCVSTAAAASSFHARCTSARACDVAAVIVAS